SVILNTTPWRPTAHGVKRRTTGAPRWGSSAPPWWSIRTGTWRWRSTTSRRPDTWHGCAGTSAWTETGHRALTAPPPPTASYAVEKATGTERGTGSLLIRPQPLVRRSGTPPR